LLTAFFVFVSLVSPICRFPFFVIPIFQFQHNVRAALSMSKWGNR